MGNTHVKPHPRTRNRKQVHWKSAGSFAKCFGHQIPSFDIDRPAPPGKPHLISEAEVKPDVITIRWTRPISDGGSPISGFLVEHRRTGSPHWVRATPLLVPFPELTLSGLEPGWRYQFRVSAENVVGISDPSEVSEPITVTLQRSAITAPRFTQELKDTVALENEKCEFIAHFLGQPAPRVCWFKDGFEIFSSRRIRILTETDKSILTIHQASLSDEGEIKCTATNRAGHVSSKARLTIEAPPSIRLPRQYEEGLLFELGETIRLKVSVAGRPTPLVFWSHNGESIQNNDRYETEFRDKSFTLKIGEATRADRGEYQIKAVNKLGEDSTSFLVTVTDKPSPPGKARVVMTLGRSVTLSWELPEDDGGCKIGNYIVEYYRLGWDVWLKAATSRQLTTMLGDLIEGSEYKFRVKAESPYGLSDPSEESEVVFIPDPKRGLIQPLRGRSQPRDVIQEVLTPVAARRKKAPRSQSSSRVEETYKLKQSGINYDIYDAGIPKRPERMKIKSPPKTPEKLSPMVPRKELGKPINKNFFDRSSMARDLAYGSPEIKAKKEIQSPVNNVSSSSEKSVSPELRDGVNHKVYKVKIDKQKDELQVEKRTSRSPSPEKLREKTVKGHQANISGSSEFMLVLCPDENEKNREELFNFDGVPPPLSLSAPELGMEPPRFFDLKNSASSTELLHERAMIRFNQAAEAEEAELERRRKCGDKRISVDVPKIQINSKDSDDIVGLERINSLRRRYSGGGVSQQQAAWAIRRQSLKSPSELLAEVSENKLVKTTPLTSEMKKEIMMNRQRSESEEIEEEEFERIRAKIASLQSQSSFERKTITVAEEEKWLAEYEESMSESDSDFSDNGTEYKFKDKIIARSDSDDYDEVETYRPTGALRIASKPTTINDPFEILTKRKEPPDPNFVPKPILKKVDTSSASSASPSRSPTTSPPMSPIINSPPRSSRSHSPRPDAVLQRNRSKSLAIPSLPPLISASSNEDIDEINIKNAVKPRSRSSSLIPSNELLQREPPRLERPRPQTSLHNVSALAGISAMAAASVVIPQKLLEKKTDAEEAKVVVDHYSDIVKSYGQRRKSNTPVYMDRDSLKSAAENLETPQSEELPTRTNGVKVNQNSIQEIESEINKQNNVGRESLERQEKKKEDKSEILYNKQVNRNFETQTEMSTKESSRRGSTNNQGVANSEVQISTRRPLTHSESATRSRRESSSPRKRSVTESKSPTRRRKQSKSPTRRGVTQSKSPSRRRQSTKSPARPENWSDVKPKESQKSGRKTSPSSMRKDLRTRKSKSPSPIPFAKRRPLLKEIMTQTSAGLDSFDLESFSRTSTPIEKLRQEELLAEAKIKVRSAVDYATDLAMFVIACWLYLFDNELFAIPVLLVMVYRQLKDEVGKRVPKWIVRRWKKKDQTERQ